MSNEEVNKVTTHWVPLKSGLEVSLRYPVYSMVTRSPFSGKGPLPSTRIVLVTPMIEEALEKFLAVEDEILESLVAEVRNEENMKL